MGKVIIQDYTTKEPLQMIGKEAGICWNAKTSDAEKNKERGRDCVLSEHGRTWEFPQVYMELDGYSARVIREFYTHIGGGPSRLQSSTRYIDYESGFTFITPPSIQNRPYLEEAYKATMEMIAKKMKYLEEEGIPREDCAMLLPLGMTTKIVCRTNFRNLVDMSRQRLCNRAFWEFRQLFRDICKALREYSDEWSWLVDTCFMPKCKVLGYCIEKKSCGMMPRKGENG